MPLHLLFDLDGTLTDPFPGITTCIQHALAALDRPISSAEDLRWCIGPPLKESFATLLGPGHVHLVDDAVAMYRERFGVSGLFENALYPGIEDSLGELQARGYKLHVATSKPGLYAERIIDHFGLCKYFDSLTGSELDGTRSDKTSLIRFVLKRHSILPEQAIMIGDRHHDIFGARENGVAGLGVLWGFGTREELEAAGAYACIDSPKLLRVWLTTS
jgi:phosphoglycolate phosphatase